MKKVHYENTIERQLNYDNREMIITEKDELF